MQFFYSYFWRLPHHSILTATVACIVGILAQSATPAFVAIVPIAFFLLLLLKDTRTIIAALTPVCIAFIAGLSYEYKSQSHTKVVQLLSTTPSLPVFITNKDRIIHRRYKERIECSATQLPLHIARPWKIFLYAPQETPWLPGDTVLLENCRIKPSKNTEFNSFMCKENIAATLFLSPQQNTLSLIERPEWSLTRLLWEKRNAMIEQLAQQLSPEAFELSSCIFWGNRDIIKNSPQTKELFKHVGITHYLARSGLHLIIFIVVWQALLNALLLPYQLKKIILFCIGTLYLIFTWPSISFFRAFALFALLTAITLNRQRAHPLYLLCCICIFLLVCNPMHLFFLDFQLTFGLTGALIWHNHVESQINLKTSEDH